MPEGNVAITIQDNALGIVSASQFGLQVVMGVTSLGTAATLYQFGDQQTLVSTLGTGPAVEAAAYVLAVGGGPVAVVPVNASVVGVASSVTATRVASSTGTVTVSGTPLDAYSVIVQVTSTGTGQLVTGGAVTVKYSLDGGNNYSQIVAVPAGGSLAISGTGLTLVFSLSTNTFDFGDKFTFTCQAPYYSTTDLANAFTGLLANPTLWGLVHVVGAPTSDTDTNNATASAAMAAALATQMSTAASNFRYARAVMDAANSTDAHLISAFATFADTRVMVGAGPLVLTSPINGRQMTRSYAWALAGRLSAVSVSTSPGAVRDGGLKGVVSLGRDERVTPGLYDARFSVARTIIGIPGFYADLGKTMAATGSDYSIIMNGRVMDVACTVTYQALVLYLNSSVRVNSAGHILEQDALGIEKFVGGLLNAQLVAPGYASSASVHVNRTDNILSTQTLRVTTRIVPLGYISAITEDIGFSNPALQVV